MTLIFSNHRFQYEVERLFRNFINEPGIKLSTDKADAQGDFCLTEKVEYPGGAELSVDLVREGKRFCMSRSIPGGMPEKEQERELCILLYKALREYTGRDLPWGILTGVRPVKVLSKLTDAQAFQSLLVSPRKLAVSRRIEQVQKPLADSIPENSFSLYVSIPFCPTRCSYCSFVSHSVNSAAARLDEYLGRMMEEMRQLSTISRHLGLVPDTIYFGGGTPTVLSAEQLKMLFSALECFDLSHIREFTVEAGRPDTITPEKLEAIKAAGVGRISVNPQTMNDSVLKAIGRSHDSRQTEEAFLMARETGFDVINMDLIAGLPTDTFDSFAASLDAVCGLSPENITVHTLSLKKGSRITLEGSPLPSPAEVSEMLDLAYDRLTAQGYAPYYLYRQKFMSGGFENVGWAKPGYVNLYNICIMEELCSIIAMGGGGSTKLVRHGDGRNIRLMAPKYPLEYIESIEKTCADKAKISEFYKDCEE